MKGALLSIKLDSQDATPDHIQLARQMEQLIRTGALKEGARLPATTELAVISGLNVARVQRAMKILVANGLIQRFPKRGTMVTSRTMQPAIGILVGADLLPEVSQFDRLLAFTLKDTLLDRNLNPQIYDGLGNPETPQGKRSARRSLEAIEYSLRHRTYTGFLMTAGLAPSSLPEALRDYPAVLFGRPRKLTDVHIDYHDFLVSSVNWLAGRGCQKIAYFSSLQLGKGGYQQHNTGFAEALEANGLEQHHEAVIDASDFEGSVPVGPAAPDRCAYYQTLEVMRRWRKQRFVPDGVIVLDDIYARGLASAFRSQWPSGSNLPQAIIQSTVGLEHFYSMPMARYVCSPQKIAETMIDRLFAKVVDKTEFSGPEAIKGHIIPDFQ